MDIRIEAVDIFPGSYAAAVNIDQWPGPGKTTLAVIGILDSKSLRQVVTETLSAHSAIDLLTLSKRAVQQFEMS